MADAMLHRAEVAALQIIIVIGVIALLIWACVLYIKAHDHETNPRREDLPPVCVRTCANVAPECYERDEECRDYEPRRLRKKYDPKTGEVETCRD